MTQSTHPFDLTGKIALVTGASGGLGAGMAIGLAAAGADVVCHGIVSVDDTMARITGWSGCQVWIRPLDALPVRPARPVT